MLIKRYRAKARKIAAHLLEVSEEDIEWELGRFYVRGNHDRAHDVIYQSMGLDVVDLWEADGVVLTHAPDDEIPRGAQIHLCGHIHPAVRLRGAGRQSERVPCFVEASTGCEAGWRLTLPAFGAFTGMHVVEPRRGREVFVVTGTEVMGPWRAEPRSGISRRGRR